MILTCPSCATQYFADDNAVGDSGRNVRCASCGHSWFAKPELPLEQRMAASGLSREKVERERAEAEAALAQPHQAFRARQRYKARTASRHAALGAWVMIAVIFAGLGTVAVTNRETVVALWPQASGAFASVGLAVNPFGLEFMEVDADRTFDGTTPVLTVDGRVANTGKRSRTAPMVRVDLRGRSGEVVETLYADVEPAVVAGGEIAAFSAFLENPPVEAFEITLSFMTDESPTAGETGSGQQDIADAGGTAMDTVPVSEPHGPDEH